MKFYDFSEYEYEAVIWAEDEEAACKKYNDEVCEIVGGDKELKPIIVDADWVLDKMLAYGPNLESDTAMEFGVAGDFYQIIKSTEPLVVLIDQMLD